MKLAWVARETPLEASATLVTGAGSVALRERLWREGRRWRGVYSDQLVVVWQDDPPWMEGAIYLGWDSAAPGVLWPTLWACRPHAELVRDAVLQRRSLSVGPWAIWPGGVVSLAEAGWHDGPLEDRP